MQRALRAHQEAELAEAAKAIVLDGGDSRAIFRQSLNGHAGRHGSSSTSAFSDAHPLNASGSSSSSSSGGSNKGTGAHTPLASASTSHSSASQPIPLSFAANREHLDGPHNPPPGTLHLSPGLGTQPGRYGSSSNYELGSSFVDGGLSASPYANGNYSEVLGGKLNKKFCHHLYTPAKEPCTDKCQLPLTALYTISCAFVFSSQVSK